MFIIQWFNLVFGWQRNGIVISVIKKREKHIWKALSPILVTPLGIVIEVRDLHHEKALSPMLVTPLGIVIEVRDSQPKKALSPMLVTPLGIMICRLLDQQDITFSSVEYKILSCI